MNKSVKKQVTIIIVIVALAMFGGVWWFNNNQTGKLDSFAQCISEKGAKFYGAFWCSHCQSQKKMFGSSEKYLPYVECSTPDSNGQLAVCKKEEISGYPTWKFSDGSTETGELSLQKLAEKTQCVLP